MRQCEPYPKLNKKKEMKDCVRSGPDITTKTHDVQFSL